MKRGVNYLLIARGFSEFALAMYTITLPLIILQLTGSLAKSGYFFALITLPSLLGMPFVGPLVERVSRQQMIQICLLLLFTLFGGQLILYHFNLMQLVLLTLIAMVITLISAVSDIATRVIFSELVPATELERYNGLKSLIDNICTFAAPMLGTFIYGLWGSQYVVGLISILLLLALWFVTQMAYTRKITPTQRTETSFGANLKAGITYIKTQKTILRLFLLAMVLNFFVAATDEIINPGIIVAKYGISKQLFGFSATAFITGVILASWLISRRPKIDLHAKLAQLFVINSLIMILIGLSSLLLIHQPWQLFYGVFLGLEALLGFCTILINIPLTAYFQAHVPLGYQGRFFAFFVFTAKLAVPLGMAYTGQLSQKMGPDSTYILNNVMVILIVLIVFHKNKAKPDT